MSYDLHLLEDVELKQRIKHIVAIIEELKWENFDPDMLTRLGLGLWNVNGHLLT